MPEVFLENEHNIRHQDISDAALTVLKKLVSSGYQALLVGGSVRDRLLGMHPKDFDIATDATPEQVHALFRNSRLIGRRFKLVHVLFGREQIEVATFRAPPRDDSCKTESAVQEQGMITRDNVYGTLDEDAMRRDFSINALYYNYADSCVLSYANAWQDLQNRTIKLIGDVETRYREDPVRMLRAVRFAAKLDLGIDEQTASGIHQFSNLLGQIPPARLFDEVLKMFLHAHAQASYFKLQEYDLFRQLFPATSRVLKAPLHKEIINNCMMNTDARIQSGKSVTPYFFFAVLLWPAMLSTRQQLDKKGVSKEDALQQAMERCIRAQIKTTAIPKRFSLCIKQIWEMQDKLTATPTRRSSALLEHPRFRAAYDFLLLREQSGENLNNMGQYWTQMQEAHPELVAKGKEKNKRPFKRGAKKPSSRHRRPKAHG